MCNRLVKILLLAFVLNVFVGCATTQISEGQVWKYKTRDLENTSEVRVIKVDEHGVHISLNKLMIKKPNAPTGYSAEVSHLPMRLDYFKSSVIKLLRKEEKFEDDYLSGYSTWHNQLINGDDVGYFTIHISEAIEYMEEALNQ